jgi:hypothetical protein
LGGTIMARDDDDSGEFEVLKESRGPKPKVTVLTMILIFLNLVAALAFVFLMSIVFQRRQSWAHATFLRDLEIVGIPLKEEDFGESGSRAALPRMRLAAADLKAAYAKRGGRATEAFRDIDERFKHTIEPRFLTDDILKAYFAADVDLGPPVRTLEEEIVRVKDEAPAAIAKAAKEYVEEVRKEGSEAKRREAVRRVVLPTAYTTPHIKAMNEKIDAVSGDDLLTFLEEGAQRRMFLEILTPLEIFRPGTLDKKDDKFLIAHAGDIELYSLKELQEQFGKRMDAAVSEKYDPDMFFGETFAGKPRGSIEKRMSIGFTLLAVAYVHKPDEKKELLFPRAVERTKKVLGLLEFSYAALDYTFCVGMLYGETIVGPDGKELINVGLMPNIFDAREGVMIVTDAKGEKRALPSASFLARHEQLVQDIMDLQRDLHSTKGRYEELKKQNEIAKETYDERVKHLAETVKKLNKDRARTAELVDQARELQRQIFDAQRALVDAAEANYLLEERIRVLQMTKKGRRP